MFSLRWLQKRQKAIAAREIRYRYHALIMGAPTFALLGIHTNGPAIAAIADSLPETQYMPFISDYTADGVRLHLIPPETYPEWCLKPYQYALARSQNMTDVQKFLPHSRLAMARIQTMDRIMFELNRSRAQLHAGVVLQESVYISKKIQAEAFRGTGYDEARLIDFPYVLLYADQASLSARDAADNIIFRADMDEATLAKTESLRMKYVDLVKQTADPQNFPNYFENSSEIAISNSSYE